MWPADAGLWGFPVKPAGLWEFPVKPSHQYRGLPVKTPHLKQTNERHRGGERTMGKYGLLNPLSQDGLGKKEKKKNKILLIPS